MESGKNSEALLYELETGNQVRHKWHVADVADNLSRLSKLIEGNRKGEKKMKMNARDLQIALDEAKEAYAALDTVDKAGKVGDYIRGNTAVQGNIRAAAKKVIEFPSMAEVSGSKFKVNTYQGREVGTPKLVESGSLPKILGTFSLAGDVLFIIDGIKSIWTGEVQCMFGCPQPIYI
ncbi:hypothetical protein [Streptomyces sp. NPDC054804]